MRCLRSLSGPAAREKVSFVLRTMEPLPELAAVKTGMSLTPPGAGLKVEAVLQLLAPVVAERLAHQAPPEVRPP